MKGDLKGRLGGRLGGGLQKGLQTGLAVKHRSVKVKSGLVQVWFSIGLKFNFFELDSEVERLVQ